MCAKRRGWVRGGRGVRRTGWWISRGDLSREISPASSRGRQLPWCRPRDDGSLPVTEPFITSIYQPPLHLALESEHSTAIYSLRIVINVDRSVPCYSTSLPSPFLLRSLSLPLPILLSPLPRRTSTRFWTLTWYWLCAFIFSIVGQLVGNGVKDHLRAAAVAAAASASLPFSLTNRPSFFSVLSFVNHRFNFISRSIIRYDYFLLRSLYRPVKNIGDICWVAR